MPTGTKLKFENDEARWKAVLARDMTAEGAFWTAVHTTGVYCRPGCSARTPKRENVSFFITREEARAAGFRPCKKCKPDEPPLVERHAKAIAAAVKMIEAAETPPRLEALAQAAEVSPHYLHRLFKAQLGVTPKQYADGVRAGRLQAELNAGSAVTEALYEAGFNAPSRMYDQAPSRLGMSPRAARKKGEGMEIRYSISDGWLGRTLVAATEKGVCSIQFGETDEELTGELLRRFPRASLEAAEEGSDYSTWIEETLAFIEEPKAAPSMPLDIRGTAFQEQVWRALMAIRPGETKTYSQIADEIGRPKAVRAVGTACGANHLAVVIPCHRVLGKDGSLTGFFWGVERKRKLLAKEAQ